MTFTADQITDLLAVWLWPFLRISALVAVAPVFGNQSIPMRVRLGIAWVLTLVIAPTLPQSEVPGLFVESWFLIALQQIGIGIVLGFALRLAFAALEVGGEVIAHLMGLGFASLVDPQNGLNVPVLSRFYVLLATQVFLGLNGHLALIEVLADSFTVLSIGVEGIGRTGLWTLVGDAGWILAAAVVIALPAAAALITVNLAFGVMTRAAPQLNIFAVGFPVTLIFGFFVLLLTLPGMLSHVEELFDQAFAFAQSVINGGA